MKSQGLKGVFLVGCSISKDMSGEVLAKPKMSFLLGQMVEIENHLSKTRQDFANLEKELKILNESISNISQWIELLDMAIEAGLKNSLFSQE